MESLGTFALAFCGGSHIGEGLLTLARYAGLAAMGVIALIVIVRVARRRRRRPTEPATSAADHMERHKVATPSSRA